MKLRYAVHYGDIASFGPFKSLVEAEDFADGLDRSRVDELLIASGHGLGEYVTAVVCGRRGSAR